MPRLPNQLFSLIAITGGLLLSGISLAQDAKPEAEAKSDPGTSKEASPEAASKEGNAADGEKGEAEGEKKPKRTYSSYENPTGLQIGVVDPNSGAQMPKEVQALAERGALASAEGKWEEALAAYEEMIKIVPRNSLAYANLGIVEYRMGRFEEAKDDLLSSLALNPTLAQNWMTLGLCYYNLGDLNLAIASLARAKHVEPKNPNGYVYMAIVVEAYGWGDAAEVELKRAITLEPNFPDAHFNLGLHYLNKKPVELELARRHYYRAIDLGAKEDPEIEARLKMAAEDDE